MELCCPRHAPPTLPRHRCRLLLTLPCPATALPFLKALAARPNPGHRLRARASEETSTFVSEKFEKIPDGTTLASVEDDSNDAISTEEDPTNDGEQSGPVDFLNKLDIKLDSEDTYSILVYGTGAVFALWITLAIVGALDSIPLFPKLMEAVGLGFTVWFSARYLIFKNSRDELFAQIESLKEQIIGRPGDDE